MKKMGDFIFKPYHPALFCSCENEQGSVRCSRTGGPLRKGVLEQSLTIRNSSASMFHMKLDENGQKRPHNEAYNAKHGCLCLRGRDHLFQSQKKVPMMRNNQFDMNVRSQLCPFTFFFPSHPTKTLAVARLALFCG